MKKIKLYSDLSEAITDIFNGDNYLNSSDYTMKIITTGGQSIFESKIHNQAFENNFSSFSHKGTCFIQIIDICSQIIDVRKIFLE
jgi:hypothetical protein